MSEETPKTGLVASGVLHAALLAFIIVGFASAPKFEDASEATPVDTVTNAEFEQMMGERTAKAPPAAQPVKPTPTQPPEPPQPPPDLLKAEETPPPPLPPKPEPPKPEPPKPEPPQPPARPAPPPPKPIPIPPPPPPRPEPLKPDALQKPQPPAKPKIVDVQPPERPREAPPKPVERPPERPKADPLAKLLAEATTKDPAKEPAKPSAKPFDPRAIARLIGETKPSTSQTNPGAPTARAQRMSGSQERQLDDWFKDAYMACWSPPPTTPEGDVYIPEVQVTFNADGTLKGQPVLVNPPPDPAWRAHAESAVRAALRCNPMKIPPQYSPFFEQWRTKTIHFDPREALG